MKHLLLSILTGTILSTTTFAQQKIDVQAHRGGMGLYPENTISSMLNAVKLGAKTLELDCVISADGKVVVSHDAYMSSDFMLKPDGSQISKSEEKSLALYKMPYDSIRKFDGGSKPNPRFPEQKKMKTYKPLLSDLIDSVEVYVKKNKLKPVYYNMETKISPAGDGVYKPAPDVFVKLVMDVIKKKNIENRTTIQSFDPRTLQILHKENAKVKLAFLLMNKDSFDDNITKLGFKPDIYSPYYTLVNEELVKKAHENKVLVLPWTVDEEKDMTQLAAYGVDGIITNQPDRMIKLFGSYQTK
ncbi:glycerophosphodiester phosphodiesterase family protein [Dyadobacter sp. CY356]|uniref:glycerophosphodiester phosphodiesterase family protein n=1 Tax=Dyadobacter sp. CY356 TaxID=2906442 RepID=UPI001F285F23|nr:glycerophosphodiester phosphodiesterase family protein [Dyadobacter sp. CY356]MCF0054669.1 glycerophosphodiester phosphodiesterase [Dyadobacter sp. CY356]